MMSHVLTKYSIYTLVYTCINRTCLKTNVNSHKLTPIGLMAFGIYIVNLNAKTNLYPGFIQRSLYNRFEAWSEFLTLRNIDINIAFFHFDSHFLSHTSFE